jgi:hypothetical protein
MIMNEKRDVQKLLFASCSFDLLANTTHLYHHHHIISIYAKFASPSTKNHSQISSNLVDPG